MTSNQPPRGETKRSLMEILVDVENGELSAEEAKAEIDSQEDVES